MTSQKSESTIFIGSQSGNDKPNIFAYQVSKPDDSSISLHQSLALCSVSNPSHIAFTHNGQLMFVVPDSPKQEESRIHAWKLIDDNGQKLDPPVHAGDWPLGGAGACQIVVHRNDRFIYVANYEDGSLSAFKDAAKRGDLVRCNLFKFDGGSHVVPSRQASSHIASILVSPSDNYVFVTDAGSDCVWKTNYSILSGFEYITELPQPFPAPEGSGPGPAVWATRKDGMFLYVGCKFSNHLLVYWVDEELFGALEQTQYLPVLPPEDAGDQEPPIEQGVTDIQISKDQQYLYIASQRRNAVSIFSIDHNGDASFVQWVESGTSIPKSLALLPDLGLILVGHENSKDLTAFAIDEDGKALRRIDINGDKKLELAYIPTRITVQE